MQQPPGRRVDRQDLHLGVKHQKAVINAGQDRFAFVSLGNDLFHVHRVVAVQLLGHQVKFPCQVAQLIPGFHGDQTPVVPLRNLARGLHKAAQGAHNPFGQDEAKNQGRNQSHTGHPNGRPNRPTRHLLCLQACVVHGGFVQLAQADAQVAHLCKQGSQVVLILV